MLKERMVERLAWQLIERDGNYALEPPDWWRMDQHIPMERYRDAAKKVLGF